MNSFLIQFQSKWPSYYFLPSISQERHEEDNAFCSCCSKSLTCSAWGTWAQFEWALKRFCPICQCRTPLALREFSSVRSYSGAFWQPDNWPCSQVANARMAGLGHLQIKILCWREGKLKGVFSRVQLTANFLSQFFSKNLHPKEKHIRSSGR